MAGIAAANMAATIPAFKVPNNFMRGFIGFKKSTGFDQHYDIHAKCQFLTIAAV
jgi:hypothetical protein